LTPLLYLDSARLGQMSPSAQRAHQDFVRFAGEVGGAIQIEDLLCGGSQTLRARWCERFPGLQAWHGIVALKSALARLAGAGPNAPVLLSSRSLHVMQLAAKMLCRTCRNILTVDSAWPRYQTVLATACRRRSRRLTTASLAGAALRGQLDEDEIVDQVCQQFFAHQCDGLFLTAVSNLGVRLPVARIVTALSPSARLVVVDGAQEFCQLPGDTARHCDLYMAGCHKWLGGYFPLGFGVLCRPQRQALFEWELQRSLRKHQFDPLLQMVESATRRRRLPAETINLSPLLSAAAAATDADVSTVEHHDRLRNANVVHEIASRAGSRTCRPSPSLRSGIVMIKPPREGVRRQSLRQRWQAFQSRNIALTAYPNGALRLSMPSRPLSEAGRQALFLALQADRAASSQHGESEGQFEELGHFV